MSLLAIILIALIIGLVLLANLKFNPYPQLKNIIAVVIIVAVVIWVLLFLFGGLHGLENVRVGG